MPLLIVKIIGHVIVSAEIGTLHVAVRFGEQLSVLGGLGGLGVRVLIVHRLKCRHLIKSTAHFILHLGSAHLKHAHKLHLQRRKPLLLFQFSAYIE